MMGTVVSGDLGELCIFCTIFGELLIPAVCLFVPFPFGLNSLVHQTFNFNRSKKRIESYPISPARLFITDHSPSSPPRFWGTRPHVEPYRRCHGTPSRSWGFPKSGIISGPDGESPHCLAHLVVHRDSLSLGVTAHSGLRPDNGGPQLAYPESHQLLTINWGVTAD